jgi:hypothetical protein
MWGKPTDFMCRGSTLLIQLNTFSTKSRKATGACCPVELRTDGGWGLCGSAGSLGQKVYRKPTHNNLYRNARSHHHPSNKQAVLSTLIHRATALCGEDSLQAELVFLKGVFKQNGYNERYYIQNFRQETRSADTAIEIQA